MGDVYESELVWFGSILLSSGWYLKIYQDVSEVNHLTCWHLGALVVHIDGNGFWCPPHSLPQVHVVGLGLNMGWHHWCSWSSPRPFRVRLAHCPTPNGTGWCVPKDHLTMDRIKLGQYLVDKCYLLLQGVCTKLVSQLGWNTGQLFFSQQCSCELQDVSRLSSISKTYCSTVAHAAQKKTWKSSTGSHTCHIRVSRRPHPNHSKQSQLWIHNETCC